MKFNIKTQEIEGSPEEIAAYIAKQHEQRVTATSSSSQKLVGKQVVKHPRSRHKKYSRKMIAYLKKAYPIAPQEDILSTLKQEFNVDVTWGCVKSIAYQHKIRRGVTLGIHYADEKVNAQSIESLPSTKICSKCKGVMQRPEGITNSSWKRRRLCKECFEKYVAPFGKQQLQALRTQQDSGVVEDFPRFTTTFAGDEVLRVFFNDLIANRRSVSRGSWQVLGIHDADQWARFCNETIRHSRELARYFSVPDLFRVNLTSDPVSLVYGKE